jgi:hypothetical protein
MLKLKDSRDLKHGDKFVYHAKAHTKSLVNLKPKYPR